MPVRMRLRIMRLGRLVARSTGNLRKGARTVMERWERIMHTVAFMVECMVADGWAKKHPATFDHILRELKRCGMEVAA